MIYFRHQSLEAVAPVMIEDIRVSPIQLNPIVRDRPILAGADFVRMQQGQRTITITLAVLEQDFEKRQRHLENITRWALSQ